MLRLFLLSLLALPVFASEQQTPSPNLEELENLPEAPQPPMPVQSGENMEPDITIVRRGDKAVQEYRRAGKLYMIKVVPDIGPPYYFIDNNGDGRLDVRSNELDQSGRFNLWKLFEW